MNDVVNITYKRDYVFNIEFDDGAAGDVDFHEYVQKGPIFKPLKTKEFFNKAFIEGGTIAWPNGADVAPETLYEKIVSSQATDRGEDIRGQINRKSNSMDTFSFLLQ